MCVAVIPTDGHIVPLVVIQSPVTFALDEVGPIPKVKDIMYVSVEQGKYTRTTLKRPGSFSGEDTFSMKPLICLYKCVLRVNILFSSLFLLLALRFVAVIRNSPHCGTHKGV